MKDEIKEILDRLDYNEWEVDLYKVPIQWSELYDIRDYITNLQEENERLKLELSGYREAILREDKLLGLQEYKQRNEKAKSLTNRTIEIIKQQPSGNDEWILERLNGINYCLGSDE